MNRRRFLQGLAPAAAALAIGGTAYGFYEASTVEVIQVSATLPRLPGAFDRLSIAYLTDILNGPYQSEEFLRSVVRTTNLLDPDVIVLGGNYAIRDPRYIQPCFDLLKELRAPLGTFGILGPHDHRLGAGVVREAMKTARIGDLSEGGVWLSRSGARLRLRGAKDSIVSVGVAVCSDESEAEAAVNERVDLILCGSSLQGQFNVRRLSGMDGAASLVERQASTVYRSRGLGVAGVPVRFGSPPEIAFLTLRKT